MNYISEIEGVKSLLKMNIDVQLKKNALVLRCDRRCRLLSHLLHRAGLDIHCTNKGIFEVDFEEYTISEILEAFDTICANPVWIVEFAEKYLNNPYMMEQAFGIETPAEEVSEI